MTSSDSGKILLTDLFMQPWKLCSEIHRLVLLPLSFFYCQWHRLKFDFSWKLYGLPILQIDRRSSVRIGKNLVLRSARHSNPLTPFNPVVISTRNAEAKISIGDSFSMTGGGVISANEISIGDNVWVGANTWIIDTDFHPLDHQERQQYPNAGRTAPITIGDNVFIGMQSTILKGVVIGSGSVIGAKSVVTHDVPAKTLVAGNPAQIIRKI